MKLEPFTRIPLRDAPPIPPKKDKGTEMTSAQGQEITKNSNARNTHFPKSKEPETSGGTTASTTAPMTTAGCTNARTA